MRFLPIAERELRVAARRPATYWLRFSVAGGLLILSAWIYLASRRAGFQEMGQVLFYVLSGALGFYTLTAGIRSTADCLSEEKREGTLGLLFLTDLRGYDVVIGKLLANSLSIFYGVLAVLPIMAVPLLMGGVTGGEFARLALVIINNLFFSLAAGMLASAVCKNARTASAVTLGIILLVAAGIPALGLLEWKLRNWTGHYTWPFLVSSPVFSFFSGVERNFRSGVGVGYVSSVIVVHIVGWVCLAWASHLVRNRWQDKPETAGAAQRRAWRDNVLEGNTTARDGFRTQMLDHNAYAWLASRPRHRILWGWAPVIAALGIWIWGGLKFGRDWFDPGIYVATAFLLSCVLRAMIGAEAGRRMLEDRKIGAMELLLSTSLRVPDILRGQWVALRRQFLGPTLVVLVACLFMWWDGFSDQNRNERIYWIWVGVAAAVMFFADAFALGWMGMWLGLSAKNPRQAFGSAVAPIMALPWFATAVVMTGYGFVGYEFRQFIRPEVLVCWLWFGFSLVADFGYGLSARHKLLTRFRETAGQRFQIKPGWWRRLTGKGAI